MARHKVDANPDSGAYWCDADDDGCHLAATDNLEAARRRARLGKPGRAVLWMRSGQRR
jgi:hypothetical protein